MTIQARLQRTSCHVAAAFAVCMTGLAPLPASAIVTFETRVSDITCGITSPDATAFGSCDRLSFSALVEPGETAFLRATLNYHYTDDGLLLPMPDIIQQTSLTWLNIDHEAGALHVYSTSNDCAGRHGGCFPGNVFSNGTVWTPLILGVNDYPDDITGSVDLFVNVSVFPDTFPSYPANLYIAVWPQSSSVAVAVPEPATWGLMAGGLTALGVLMRRRRKDVALRAAATAG